MMEQNPRYMVGTAKIHCPACGEAMIVEVLMKNVGQDPIGASWLEVEFQKLSVKHKCPFS